MWNKPYHFNAAVAHLLDNLPSPNKQNKRVWYRHNILCEDSGPTCVTNVLLLRGKAGDLFQSQ